MWPKAITGFICGLVSADGYVGRKDTLGPHIGIISTVEKKRGEEVRAILRDSGITTSLNKSGRSPHSGKRKYWVYLSQKNGQWQILLESIEYWHMENWIGERKYALLKDLVRGTILYNGSGLTKMRRTFQELFKIVNTFLNEEEWVTPHHIAKKTGLDIRTVYRVLKKWNWASHENFKSWARKPWWVGLPKIELAHNSKRIFAVKKLKEKIGG